ncbi:MAG: hypothetical protein ACE5GU_12690 [Candidatus Scalinduaceae bacterium]
MKKIIIIATAITIIILGVGGYYYWKRTTSPEYSLWQAKKAFEQHDLISFEKYVDIEGITSSLIGQILEISTEQEKPKDEWEQLGESFGKGLVALLKPQLGKLAKQQVAEIVESGRFEEKKEDKTSEEPEFSLSEIWNKVGGEETGFQGIEYVEKEGKIAYIGLKFFQKKYNMDLILDLKMRDKGGYWQVAELSNFADYMKKMDELETKRIDELNAQIIEAMKKILVVEKVWKINKTKTVWVQVKNNGEKEIDRYKILLICNSLDGKELKRFNVVDYDNILPGKTGRGYWKADSNMSGDNLLFDTPPTKFEVKADIQSIEFIDGTILQRYKK